MTPLCELADKYQTDKGGKETLYRGEPTGTCHTYTKVYYELLEGRDIKRVIEIGVNSGASLRMWEEFFPDADIYGIDIREEVLFNEGRIKCMYADQSDPISLIRAVNCMGSGYFDLIVDDGSHELSHQITSMVTLLPYLRWNGSYVIEDVGALHCDIDVIGALIPPGYHMESVDCPDGIGRAHCPACGGPEALIIIEPE